MLTLGASLIPEARLQQCVSPRLILQSQIMELSADDLLERIRAELEANPALEIVDEVFHFSPPCVPPTTLESSEALDRLSTPYTLADDLRLQLAQVRGVRRDIFHYLIDSLDERGYLGADLGEVAAHCRAPRREAEAALAALQSLEPAGIGARSLRECLLLQLRRFPAQVIPPQTETFISTYLNTSRKQSPAQAAAVLQLSDDDLASILDFVSSHLYMWPADRFREQRDGDQASEDLVFPDAWITEAGGRLQVRVAQSWSHSLRVSEAYARLDSQMRRARHVAPEERERVTEQVRNARAFICHLARREAVLKQVTEAVIAAQRGFFLAGAQAMRPLTRKEVAAALRIHESTISRITRDKYVQLPDAQLVPFDFFFDGSLSAKAALRSLVQEEDPAHPLSDAALTERLQALAYPLARRTVAKYRARLGLPPAHKRRRSATASSSQRGRQTIPRQTR